MVYDEPVLRYWCKKELANAVSVLPVIFEKQYYGIALTPNSTLRKPINQVVLEKIQSPQWQEMLQEYLGQ